MAGSGGSTRRSRATPPHPEFSAFSVVGVVVVAEAVAAAGRPAAEAVAADRPAAAAPCNPAVAFALAEMLAVRVLGD